MNYTPLGRPLRIGNFQDGRAYSTKHSSFRKSNLFYGVAVEPAVVIKTFTDLGWRDFSSIVETGTPSDYIAVRQPDETEMIADEDSNRAEFQDISNNHGRQYAHMLLVHKLQYVRLRSVAPWLSPEAKFVMIRRESFFRGHRMCAAIIQRRVKGAVLGGDIVNLYSGLVGSPWKKHMPKISSQLRFLISSQAKDHVDWNIQNFVFNTDDEQLYYVDSKPSFMIPSYSNTRNRDSVIRCLLSY